MDLFQIERYGVDTNEEDAIKEQQRIFQERIEKRKHLKRGIGTEDLPKRKRKKKVDRNVYDVDSQATGDDVSSEDEKKQKKKKTRMIQDEVLDKQLENSDGNDDVDASRKKKKKKKKDDNTKKEPNENILENTGSPKKKKKKKKSEEVFDEEISESKRDIDSIDLNEIKIKKKKKKKKREEDECIDNENDEIPLEENNDDTEIESRAVDKKSQGYFPILHKHQHTRKVKLKRNLPRWLAEPVVMKSDQLKLDDIDFLTKSSIENLKNIDVSHLFPVQSNVIPAILNMHKDRKVCFPFRDVCVQSPTGSGKTFSYVLPIVEILSKNIIRELQCLVILPSKDLAVQVRRTFDQCLIGTKLKVGLVAGAKTFAKEQESIIISRPSGHYSLVDILVATPGHLVDHLKLTTGFSLSKLRFLIIDEADRMLSENYDNWLELSKNSIQNDNRDSIYPLTAAKFSKPIHHVQKFLFSATLTENPEKLAALDLFNPLLFMSQSAIVESQDADQENHSKKYAVPEKLQEKMLVIDTYQKPMALLHIVLAYDYKCILCFTNSIESTHRLYLLLKQFDGVKAAEFSSSLNETQRRGVLRDFRNGKLNLLIATDAMSRGMDIKKVDLVVNYEAPVNAKTYIHRVGRTARGGEEGEAITILLSREVYYYKQMRKSLSAVNKLQKFTIQYQSLSTYGDQYETSLLELKKKLEREKRKY